MKLRYLTARTPAIERILLVESGARSISERVLPNLRLIFGDHVHIDVFTCYPGAPEGLGSGAAVFRTQDFPVPAARARLIATIRNSGITALAIICSHEKIMTRWKWWLAWKLPAKVLIVNENADFFWLDSAHLATARRFALLRAGISGTGAGVAPAVGNVVAFPFVLGYLLLYAAVAHTRRAVRLRFHFEKS